VIAIFFLSGREYISRLHRAEEHVRVEILRCITNPSLEALTLEVAQLPNHTVGFWCESHVIDTASKGRWGKTRETKSSKKCLNIGKQIS
jgi:hypothetical protein